MIGSAIKEDKAVANSELHLFAKNHPLDANYSTVALRNNKILKANQNYVNRIPNYCINREIPRDKTKEKL
jgi:hypothetical protein